MLNYIRSPLREAQDAARARGDHTFTISEPCAHGHNAPRYASNGVCVTCAVEYRASAKPVHQRRMKLATKDTSVIQVSQDRSTAALHAVAHKRFAEIVGRAASNSVIHKAAISLLASYLGGHPSAPEVKALLR